MSGINLLYPADWQDVLFRLCLAIVLGGIIGWERETDRKPAGLRTHMLVSLGTALLVLSSIQTGMVQTTADSLSRVIQGIITGVGFLGAGEIFSESRLGSGEVRVRGLTSAAAIWVSSALGIAAGCGLWQMGLFGAIATVIILRGVKKLETRINRSRHRNPEDI
ncbi:MAG: MgtC/SapB family protein [Cyanobacteria bacterium CRU_2_1]|nr:MgtC/SapB family protein [Cyanobacteria bacterium RU_5_0]NJR60906.1 MgtC/SapB family protein [Cyanobacteria bacterium CRU_2_1]